MTMSRHRRSAQVAEASFRRLRDEICLQAGGPVAQVILVASARRGEGRTTVAWGLARAFARTGSGSVVLADFDLLQPSLSRLLGAASSPGISDVLRGTASPDEALLATAEGSLRLLPAGAQSEDAGLLLASPAMARLLSELRGRSSTVILDSVPVEEGTVVQTIAGHADAAVLVVRANRTLEQDARAAAARLRAAGVDLLGVVLNASRDAASRALPLPAEGSARRRATPATAEPASRGSERP
jgi:capsular exopolysaccharide synthesis family protein